MTTLLGPCNIGNQKQFPQFWKKTKLITSREFISLAALHLSS
jgi:hypothetical protein